MYQYVPDAQLKRKGITYHMFFSAILFFLHKVPQPLLLLMNARLSMYLCSDFCKSSLNDIEETICLMTHLSYNYLGIYLIFVLLYCCVK